MTREKTNTMTHLLWRITRATVLSVLLPASAVMALSFPDVYFFPFTPGYSFSLVSDRGNTLQVTTRITIPEDPDPQSFDLDWNLRISLEHQTLSYTLRFAVLPTGDILLSELSDEHTGRSFEARPLVFPRSPKIGAPVVLGESMSLTFVKKLPSLKVGEKSYQDIWVADLVLGNATNQIYFAQKNAIVGVKTPSETFRRR